MKSQAEQRIHDMLLEVFEGAQAPACGSQEHAQLLADLREVLDAWDSQALAAIGLRCVQLLLNRQQARMVADRQIALTKDERN